MKLDDLLPYLLDEVPGAPFSIAKRALLQSCTEFCLMTHAWDQVQDPILLQDNVNQYDVDIPPGGRVASVRSVWMADRTLTPKTMEEVSLLIPNWQAAQSSHPAFYNANTDFAVITVFPIPIGVADQTITIRASFAPTLTATSLPDAVINRYLEPILSGAKFRLMAAPGKAWSNPALAGMHKSMFDSGVNLARTDALMDRSEGSMRVRPVRFGF